MVIKDYIKSNKRPLTSALFCFIAVGIVLFFYNSFGNNLLEYLYQSGLFKTILGQNAESFESCVSYFNYFFYFCLPVLAVCLSLLFVFKDNLTLNIICLSVCFVLFISGYSVYVSDQLQYMILPFKNIFPDFCVNDWFVWKTSHYHLFFNYLIRFVYFVMFGNIELGIFAVWFITIIALFYGIYFLTKSLGGNYKNFLTVVIFIVFYSSNTLGDAFIYSNFLIPTLIAFVIIVYSIAFLIMDKYVKSFALLGLSSLVHVNYGIIGLPVYTIYLLFKIRDIKLKNMLICYVVFFVLALPTLIPTISNFFLGTDNIDGINLVFYLRSPHHYYPLMFQKKLWIVTLTPIFISVLLIIKNKQIDRRILILMSIIIFIISFCAVMSIAGGPNIFTKIYSWRFMPLVLILSYIVIAREINSISKFKFINMSLLFVLFYIVGCLWGIRFGVIYSFCVISLLYILRSLPLCWPNRNITYSMIIFLVLFSGLLEGKLHPSFKKNEIFNHNNAMAWIKNNIEKDSLFMTPPNLSEIRVLGFRSAIVDFKCAPIGSGTDMIEWKKRLEVVCNAPNLETFPEKSFYLASKLEELYLSNSLEYVKKVMNIYKAGYFITSLKHNNIEDFINDKNFNVIYKDDKLIIFKKLT